MLCPNGLNGASLTDSHLILLSLVRSRTRRYPLVYENIYSSEFHSSVGSRYSRLLNDLKLRNLIEVNDSYKIGSFPKSYRLSQYARELPWGMKLCKKPYVIKPNAETPKSESPLLQFVINNLSQLSFNESLDQSMYGPEIDFLIQETRIQLLEKRFKVSRGDNSGRLFHPLTQCKREARQFFGLDGEALIEGDIKSCFPVLLASRLYGVESALAEYSKYSNLLLHDDIYSFLCPNRNRDAVKRHLQYVLARDPYGTISATIENNLSEHFPILYESIAIKGKDNPIALQSYEAKLMIDGVVSDCMAADRFIIPIHDGFLCRASDYPAIKALAQAIFKKEVGFAPKIEKKQNFPTNTQNLV